MQVMRISCIPFVILSTVLALPGARAGWFDFKKLDGMCKENHTPEEYKLANEAGLAMHNIFRCMHNAPPMVLSNAAIKVGQDYSEKFVNGLVAGHSHTKGFGENLWGNDVHTLPTNLTEFMISATRSWYSEVEYYIDFRKEKDGQATGHFTQLVWKESLELGMGASLGTETECGDTQYIMVAGEYAPNGNFNYQEAFDENVEGKPSRTEEYCTRVIGAMLKRSPGLTYFQEKYLTNNEPFQTYARISPGYTYLLQKKPTKRRSAGFFYSIQNHPTQGVRSHLSRRGQGFYYSVQNYPSLV